MTTQFEIIATLNNCPHTNYESKIETIDLSGWKDGFSVDVFKSKLTDRLVVNHNGSPVAAILFDEFKTCMFRETLPNYRRQDIQSNLWALSVMVLGDIRHSEHLTDMGKILVK